MRIEIAHIGILPPIYDNDKKIKDFEREKRKKKNEKDTEGYQKHERFQGQWRELGQYSTFRELL